jgi:hypothetical protein
MPTDATLLAASLLIVGLIALPAVSAWRRRRFSREASAVAAELVAFAQALRRSDGAAVLDETLRVRARRLAMPELRSFELAQRLAPAMPGLLADAAQRLALRLKRRVAFERKMLARTASGRRRGAIAAALPPLILVTLAAAGRGLPMSALLFVAGLEVLGCWLLLRVTRVAP